MLGQCELAEGSEAETSKETRQVAVCLKGKFGGEGVAYAEAPREDIFLDYGAAYAGLFLGPWVSSHILGRWRNQEPIRDHMPRQRILFTDYALLQFGNPVLHRYRMTIGRLRLPFGLDQSEAPEYYQALENRRFWDSPRDGGYLTYDDLRRFRVDIGGAVSDLRSARQRSMQSQGPREFERAVSVRAMLDISALEGTRLVASGYGSIVGQRRFGFGVLNTNRKGDFTNLEFVRLLTTPGGERDPFEQILRAGYTSAWQSIGRWVIQFDDEHLRFRRIVIDYDKIISANLFARFSVGYLHGQDSSRLSRWAFTTGIETKL
jgi:hypothetical protein